MEKKKKLLIINPGSTSTKVALYEERTPVLERDLMVDLEKIKDCVRMIDQLQLRLDTVKDFIKEEKINMSEVDMIVARGGSINGVKSGAYMITEHVETMLRYAPRSQHVSSLAGIIAYILGKEYRIPSMFYDGVSADDADEIMHYTGIPEVKRFVTSHCLNSKMVAREIAEEMGKKYEDCNYIILHLGGGTSITAHEKGKMIDGNRAGDGQGPISPNRSGDLCVDDVIKCIKKGISPDEAKDYASSKGGLLAWCGTDDLREVKAMIANGDKKAELVYNTMIYSMGKWTAMMAGALKGKVDAILLTGGMARDTELCDKLAEYISWIAPIYNYAGSFETEALGFGAIRVLKGDEEAKTYTGKPVWNGFPWDKE